MTPDATEVIRDGVNVLRLLGTRLREAAEKREALWLVVRDVEGFAGRLSEVDEDIDVDLEFIGRIWLGGQDLAVMDEVASGVLERDAGISKRLGSAERAAVGRLRALLAGANNMA